MNLPAHDTASPDPSKASLHRTTHTGHRQQHYRLAPPGEIYPNRLAERLYR